MNNNVGKGAVVLTVSGLVCKLFGALFRLPLTNIIGLEGIAIFQMVMTIYSFALVCVSGGVTNTLSKLVSSARARGDQKAIGGYLKQALLFSVWLCIIFSLIFLFFAPSISSFQGANGGEGSYRLLAILLPLGALVGVARGILQGYGNMTPTAISQIIEQVVKFAFGLIFAYLFKGYGAEGGVFGAVLGIVVSEVFACFYLAIKFKLIGKISLISGYKKTFYNACVPLTLGGVILPFIHALEAIFIVKLLILSGLMQDAAKVVYGLQSGVVGAIMNFPLIISVAVASALLPNLSFLAEKKEEKKQRGVISTSIGCMWFLLVPLVVGIGAISNKVYPILYPEVMGNYLSLAVQLTYVNSLSVVCTALMQILVSILLANGYFKDLLVFYSIGGIVKVAYLILCSLHINVSSFAIAISNFVLASVVSICIIIRLKKLIYVPAFDILLPILSSIVMFIVVRILLDLIPSPVGLILAVVIAIAVYIVLSFPLTSKYAKLLLSSIKKERN